MSERIREHSWVSNELSAIIEPGVTHGRRNFIDPILLADVASSGSGWKDGLGILAGLSGIGVAGVGIGIGTYFYQKGEAEKIRAEKGTNEPLKARVSVGASSRAETSDTSQ